MHKLSISCGTYFISTSFHSKPFLLLSLHGRRKWKSLEHPLTFSSKRKSNGKHASYGSRKTFIPFHIFISICSFILICNSLEQSSRDANTFKCHICYSLWHLCPYFRCCCFRVPPKFFFNCCCSCLCSNWKQADLRTWQVKWQVRQVHLFQLEPDVQTETDVLSVKLPQRKSNLPNNGKENRIKCPNSFCSFTKKIKQLKHKSAKKGRKKKRISKDEARALITFSNRFS